MDQTSQNELVKRIIESESFGSSALHAKLLAFLVSTSQQGEVPKESVIAVHLYGVQDQIHSEGGKVRVHMFHLRKKLKAYFDGEGKQESFRLTIPKGSYEVAFVEQQQEEIAAADRFLWSKQAMFAGAIGIGLILFGLGWLIGTETEKGDPAFPEESIAQSPFWKKVFDDDKSIMIVIGDLFMIKETLKVRKENRTIRFGHINSLEEFEEYQNTLTDSLATYEIQDYSFLIRNSKDWVQRLTQLFYVNKKPFQIRLSSQIDVRDLHDHHIVFVGMQKTAGFLNTYFYQSAFSYDSSRTEAYFLDGKVYSPSGDPKAMHTDYAFVSRYTGPHNNQIFLFGGLWDTGASQALNNFTDLHLLQQIEAQFDEVQVSPKQDFEVLFKVTGIDRTELNTEMEVVNQLE